RNTSGIVRPVCSRNFRERRRKVKADSMYYLAAACVVAMIIALTIVSYWHHQERMAKIAAGITTQEGGEK
ncbi:MAG: hypothetical protein IKO55_10275, partial [Kiritimatiellae bacterium]|nr:hypothetical protein [Kiritimatiellia bacterium]